MGCFKVITTSFNYSRTFSEQSITVHCAGIPLLATVPLLALFTSIIVPLCKLLQPGKPLCYYNCAVVPLLVTLRVVLIYVIVPLCKLLLLGGPLCYNNCADVLAVPGPMYMCAPYYTTVLVNPKQFRCGGVASLVKSTSNPMVSLCIVCYLLFKLIEEVHSNTNANVLYMCSGAPLIGQLWRCTPSIRPLVSYTPASITSGVPPPPTCALPYLCHCAYFPLYQCHFEGVPLYQYHCAGVPLHQYHCEDVPP